MTRKRKHDKVSKDVPGDGGNSDSKFAVGVASTNSVSSLSALRRSRPRRSRQNVRTSPRSTVLANRKPPSDKGLNFSLEIDLVQPETKKPPPAICLVDSESDDDRKPAAKPSGRKSLSKSGSRGSSHVSTRDLSYGDAASLELARKLQEEENERGKFVHPKTAAEDEAFARSLQRSLSLQEEQKRYFIESKDLALARKLQEEAEAEEKLAKQALEDAEVAMKETITGKSLSLVKEVIEFVDKHGQANGKVDPTLGYTIEAVAKDDLFELAKATFELQEEFRNAGKPFTLDIGIHYTNSANLAKIQTDGLLTKPDRDAKNIKPERYNGSGKFAGRASLLDCLHVTHLTRSCPAALGDGIYTADGYTLGLHYGDIGIFVARLTGVALNQKSYKQREAHDTFVRGRSPLDKVSVLRQSRQCLALVRYSSGLVGFVTPTSSNAGILILDSYREGLQRIIDRHFNQNTGTPVSANQPVPAASPVTSGSIFNSIAQYFNPALKNQPVPTQHALANATSVIGQQPSNPLASTPVVPVPVPRPTAAPSTLPTVPTTKRSSVVGSRPKQTKAKPSLGATKSSETLHYTAPSHLSHNCASLFRRELAMMDLGDCSICLSNIQNGNDIGSLAACGHRFHLECVHRMLQNCRRCPVCRTQLGEPQVRAWKLPETGLRAGYV